MSKILLTGVSGYIGKRLLPLLVKQGYDVVCCLREPRRLDLNLPSGLKKRVTLLAIDFLKPTASAVQAIPEDIDAAYYLLHSMSSKQKDFATLEEKVAKNFVDCLRHTKIKQLIYLSGITNVNETQLSPHLRSRQNVESILLQAPFALTTLRAGIIIGAGSASFEIIRDLVEKLPVMIAPEWLKTRSQPIAVSDVMQLLSKVLFYEPGYNRSYDIGGPEILSYKQMLLKFAAVRQLKRWIITVPIITPRLSSYWLFFITRVSYSLAVNLVNSMKVEVICQNKEYLAQTFGLRGMSYTQAVESAFAQIEQNEVVSSWHDAFNDSRLNPDLTEFIKIPSHGCLCDKRKMRLANSNTDPLCNVDVVLDRIWSIGGDTGWYYANWLWHLRGWFDRLCGGVGLRRGRRNPYTLTAGDALDFWRVILASKDQKRLLLFAEMKLPGEAWLEFFIDADLYLHQNAVFRPRGLLGRLYWYALLPLHNLIFRGMLRHIGHISPKNA